MQVATIDKIAELQSIISRMSLEVFCAIALPEIGVRWRDVAKAVRNSRLPMQIKNVARVLCKHVSKSLTLEEIEDIVARLRLKMVATQSRTWHVIRLEEKTTDEPVVDTMRMLPGRITQLLRKSKRPVRPEVQMVHLGDLLYLSVQLKSEQKDGSILFVATPPGQPVVLASSPNMKGLLRAIIEALGYKKFAPANLYGRHIPSLLRMNDDAYNANADHLHEVPEYAPAPVITSNSIDYTNRNYDEIYVDKVLGPEPPILTVLTIKTSKALFNSEVLNKNINATIHLKSANVADTLKSWVLAGVIAPTTDLFKIFHELKSNSITYTGDDSD